jgi:hypothetical protein
MSTDLIQHAFHGQESWAPVPGWEGYYDVSDNGRVRSLDRVDSLGRSVYGRIRLLNAKRDGHLQVQFARGDEVSTVMVHRLVLEAFTGPCPDGMEGCHDNGSPSDNRLTNLRWDTRSANRHDTVRHGVDHNASRTHCLRGHEFSEENTHVADGRRHCRTCQRIRTQAYRARLHKLMGGSEPLDTSERHLAAVGS